MDYILILAIIVVSSYILQTILGIHQIKHFNSVYSELRKKGRVAIGRRSGKIRSGTIVMFAINKSGEILEARKMQGVTIMARFKEMPSYIGVDIHYLDKYNPIVRKENKLLQIAIEDAREIFLRTEVGNYKESSSSIPAFLNISTNLQLLFSKYKSKKRNKV